MLYLYTVTIKIAYTGYCGYMMYYHCIERWYFSSFYHGFCFRMWQPCWTGNAQHGKQRSGGWNAAGTGPEYCWNGMKIEDWDAGDAGDACKKFVTTFWCLKVDQVGLKKDTAGELALRTQIAHTAFTTGIQLNIFVGIYLFGRFLSISLISVPFFWKSSMHWLVCVCVGSQQCQLVAGLWPTCSSFPEVMMEKASFYLMQQTWSY